MPSEGHDHRQQRNEAHACGNAQKSPAPSGEPQTNEVEADDAADGRVDLLLCAKSRQQERRKVHAEELGGDSDEVGSRSEKRSSSGRGWFVSPEPRKEDEGDDQGESAARAIVGTRQRESSEQRPEYAETPADELGNASNEAHPKSVRRHY